MRPGGADEGLVSTNSNTIGYIASRGLQKQGMKAYQLSDSLISQTPLAGLPSWMPSVAHKSRSYVRELDLVHLESMQRETLIVHSHKGAYVTAVTAKLKRDEDIYPVVLRTLSALVNAFSKIARRGIASLQQIVLHRHDMDLWKTDNCSAAAGRLRHRPFLCRTFLYPTDLISYELREDDRRSSIAMAVRKVHPFYSTPRQSKSSKPATATPSAKGSPLLARSLK